MAEKWRLPKGKTWRGKLEEKHLNHGKVVPVPPKMRKQYGTGTMLIPRPLDVEAVMRGVRKGRLITNTQIRDRLAAASKADSACPFATGMFVRIVAEAAEEDRRAGRKRITPYWRTIKAGGKLCENYPGGAKAQATKLRKEGFTISPGKGKQPPKVKGFEKYLIQSP